MIRKLKFMFAANFLISMLVYGGYIAICLMRGLDIDHQLGVDSHHGRGGPLWALVAFLEIQILVIWFVQRHSDDSITFRHRVAYLLWGVLIMFLGLGQPFITYVGCSDVT